MKNETQGQRLARLRTEKGLSQAALAKAVGLSGQGAIGNIERDMRGYGASIVDIAKTLGTTPEYLRLQTDEQPLQTAVSEPISRDPNDTYQNVSNPSIITSDLKTYAINPNKIRKIWVVGKTMGGLPERIWTDSDFPVGDLYDYSEESSTDPSAFLCEVEGTSMLERYSPGEFALVEPNTPIQPGDDVLVRLRTGETMLKRLDMLQNGYRLRSLNGGEQLFFLESAISWIYYVAHPVPRRKIKTRH